MTAWKKGLQITFVVTPTADKESITRQVKGFLRNLENNKAIEESELNYRILMQEIEVVQK